MIVLWILSVFVAGVIGTLLKAWVLVLLWDWFVVPVFHYPSLSMPYALGLSLVAWYMTNQPKPDQKDERGWREKMIEGLLLQLFVPLFVLLFGWCYKQFI